MPILSRSLAEGQGGGARVDSCQAFRGHGISAVFREPLA
jgi:hypothetical protein